MKLKSVYKHYLKPLPEIPQSADFLPLFIPANDNIKPRLEPFMGTSVIKSVQAFSITIGSAATSNTFTLGTSVSTSNSVIFFGSFQTHEIANTAYKFYNTRLELTNTNTVTAFRDTADAAVIAYGTVVEFASSAITLVQQGTITIPTSSASNTAAISSVDTTKAAVFYLGVTNSGSSAQATNCLAKLDLTNATTVTAAVNTASSLESTTVGYCVVEFATGVLASVQPRSVTSTASGTSMTDTITAVTMANTILLYNGSTSATGTNYGAFFYNLQLTSTTQVTLTRATSNLSSRTINYTALEFASGVLNSAVQRGTISLASVTSNTATLSSSISTTYGLVNWTGFSSSLSPGVPAEGFADVVLTDGSTVTAAKDTATGTSVVGYEAFEFAPPAAGATPINNLGGWFGI